MKVAEKGDTVKVHYTGKLKNGEVFDSSQNRDPLEVELGSGNIIEGFNDGILGMKEGEEKTLEIPSDKAYGPRNEQFVLDIKKENLPQDLDPKEGMRLSMSNPDPEAPPIPVEIIDVKDEKVVIDANPTLAGEDLIFDVELVGIMKGDNE